MSKHMIVGVEVENIPEDYSPGWYMVARSVDGSLWYYVVYKHRERAAQVAKEIISGVVLEM